MTDTGVVYRRNLLKAAAPALTGAAAAFAGAPAAAEKVRIEAEYDVIVCGGGASGVPAAVAAARAGRKVALINR